MLRPARTPLVIATASLAVALSACAPNASEADTTVAVTATDSTCELAQTEVPAGTISFEITNEGDAVTEFYVLREDGGIVSELEDIAPGATGTLAVPLTAGTYETECEPSGGEGIEVELTVTG